jgi:transcriptional regulator with XRE-family HTH domain
MAMARRRLHLSQAELAERLGMSLRGYQDLERADASVKPVYFLALEFLQLQVAAERKAPELASVQGRALALEIAALIKGA